MQIIIGWKNGRVTQAVLADPVKTEIRSVPIDLDQKEFDALPPGEYRYSELPWIYADYLYVYDNLTGRILVFQPDALIIDFDFDLYDRLVRAPQTFTCDGQEIREDPPVEQTVIIPEPADGQNRPRRGGHGN